MTDLERIWFALRGVYGEDLQAATVTVLIKNGDTGVRFETFTFPQVETEE